MFQDQWQSAVYRPVDKVSHTGKLKIEYIPADDLVQLEGNPRRAKPGSTALEKLKLLITEHGFQNPLQVYLEKNKKYSILCGNHRFEAGKQCGIKDFPCIVYSGGRGKALARAVSDNKSADWTEWDLPLLKDMIGEIDTGEFDIELTGFGQDELEKLFQSGDETKEKNYLDDVDGFSVIVECDDEEHQCKLLKKLEQLKYKCRPLIS